MSIYTQKVVGFFFQIKDSEMGAGRGELLGKQVRQRDLI